MSTPDVGPTLATVEPLLLTATQAAELLSIGRTTIYQLVWSGELKPIRIGRSVRFAVDDLEAFVSAKRGG